jgi:hypothetical protein
MEDLQQMACREDQSCYFLVTRRISVQVGLEQFQADLLADQPFRRRFLCYACRIEVDSAL